MALSNKAYAPSDGQSAEINKIQPHLIFNKVAGVGIIAFASVMAYSSLVLPDSYYDVSCQTEAGTFTHTVQIDNIAIGNKDPLASYQAFKLADGTMLNVPSKLCTAESIAQPVPANM